MNHIQDTNPDNITESKSSSRAGSPQSDPSSDNVLKELSASCANTEEKSSEKNIDVNIPIAGLQKADENELNSENITLTSKDLKPEKNKLISSRNLDSKDETMPTIQIKQ